MTDRTDKKVWLITGAGRGMGVDFARAALAAGPRRFIAGADAIATAEQKVADLQAQIAVYRDLSTSLGFDRLEPAGSAT